ncbi:2575_t:CDS:1, partial [Acaulospora colombiana]
DHPTDVVIAIDMESPKHQDTTPHGMVFTNATPTTATWNATSFQERSDQIVDVEFETEGGHFEEDGMMTGAEVEMTTAPTYGEEYEYEMTYDTGAADPGYEVEDAEVLDAEVLDAAHGAEPHVEGGFVPFVHEISETVFAPSHIAEPETLEASSYAPPPLNAAETQAPEHESKVEPLATNDHKNEAPVVSEAESTNPNPPEEATTVEPAQINLEAPIADRRPTPPADEQRAEVTASPSLAKLATEQEASLELKEPPPETSEVHVTEGGEEPEEVVAVPEETYDEGDA